MIRENTCSIQRFYRPAAIEEQEEEMEKEEKLKALEAALGQIEK